MLIIEVDQADPFLNLIDRLSRFLPVLMDGQGWIILETGRELVFAFKPLADPPPRAWYNLERRKIFVRCLGQLEVKKRSITIFLRSTPSTPFRQQDLVVDASNNSRDDTPMCHTSLQKTMS